MGMRIEKIPTLDFTFKHNRKVDLTGTAVSVVRRLPEYVRALRRLKAVVRETQPDIILNFFEAVTGIYALTTWKRPPVLAVAHQFMYGHSSYVRAPKLRFQQWIMKWFVRMVGSRSSRVALSFYEAPDVPKRQTKICPPILRRQLFKMEPNPNGDFVLVYLLNHGYAEQITAWHKANPATKLHCFYDKPGAPAELKVDETLTFHRLDGEKFLRMMAECKYVACTAGFESLSEAAYFGKPLFLVPVENHVEQQINAIDATGIGWGVTDSWFNLDRLTEMPPRVPNAVFKEWLSRADSILLSAMEDAVRVRAKVTIEAKGTELEVSPVREALPAIADLARLSATSMVQRNRTERVTLKCRMPLGHSVVPSGLATSTVRKPGLKPLAYFNSSRQDGDRSS
jgi:uncharacterized protein (TIGR00661 family)